MITGARSSETPIWTAIWTPEDAHEQDHADRLRDPVDIADQRVPDPAVPAPGQIAPRHRGKRREGAGAQIGDEVDPQPRDVRVAPEEDEKAQQDQRRKQHEQPSDLQVPGVDPRRAQHLA